jgi:hypothetical protein
MNVDRILETFNRHQVNYLLIGGMNFLLRHKPVLTYDVDLWVEDGEENLRRCEAALAALEAEWGRSDADWGKVAHRASGWLGTQPVFCLTSPHGAIDIFREVRGLTNWREARARALYERTTSGIPYWGLADEDMLRCQQVLDEPQRNRDRIATLQEALRGKPK